MTDDTTQMNLQWLQSTRNEDPVDYSIACKFKKPIEERHPYLDSLSEGKDLDDYGSKVDALVDSMGVTAEEVSTTHRRKDLDLL